MKTMLMFLLVLTVVATAGAQDPGAGLIVVSGDTMGETCTAYDFAPGLLLVYVVILDAPCLTACQFRVVTPPTLTYLGEVSYFPVYIGSSQTGITVGFGVPLSSPITVLQISYFEMGLSGPCTEIAIAPDPAAFPPGEIWTADCNSNLMLASGRGLMLNPTPDCDECSEIPIGNERSSWGQVKALYAD